MLYRYYITEEIKNWLKKQNFGTIIQEKLNEYLKSEMENKDFSLIKGSFIMNKITKSSRPTFCWKMVQKDDFVVYVLRRIYLHDDYQKKINKGTIDNWVIKHDLSDKEETEINEFFENVLHPNWQEQLNNLPDLSAKELNFISCPLDINHKLFRDAIYETEEWIKYIQNKQQFTDYDNAAISIENHILENVNSDDGWQKIQFKDNIIFIYHTGENWVLSEMGKYNPNCDYSEKLDKPAPENYRRGYPYSFLDDKDDWREMELEKKSNLVLSQKQVEIVSGNIQYPLFITGRAGSGKSTVLQYLFAEIILRYIQNNKIECDGTLLPPVYLSYSPTLIDDAKNLSTILLQKNSCYKRILVSHNIDYCNDILPIFDEMFYVFQELVKKCIRIHDADYISGHFKKADYISFARFNSMWNEHFQKISETDKKEYGPSISWHVIRTYIKGWDSEKILTPEDYADLPIKQQTVSHSTYNIIFEKVWKNWYSNIGEKEWDDQDLVRFCLENKYVDEMYSGVFCDEAQDFTRVELDFILKISSFANRSIQQVSDVKKLPFVFAGDEFQTLNPTGFSWESLRGYFTDRLFGLIGLEKYKDDSGLDDPIELSENFRSTRQVVKLANRIQLLRAARFDDTSKPQSSYFSNDGAPVFCLSPKDKMVIEQLKEKKVVLIIPTTDGESAESFIKNSQLKEMIEFVDGVPQGITILNPAQAKGLEYPNVAIYGFDCSGANRLLSTEQLSDWFDHPQKDEKMDIELKYQVSNAYVAVTRAGTNLYIIDDFDRDSFWNFAFTHSNPENKIEVQKLQEKMLSKLSSANRCKWDENDLGGILKGNPDNVTDDNIEYLMSNEGRESLEKRAEALSDAFLMRQAAGFHLSAGDKLGEARCWAKSYLYEKEHLKAAEKFEEARMFGDAVNSYWEELCIDFKESGKSALTENLIKKTARHKENCQSLKADICAMYSQNPDMRDFKMSLDALCAKMTSEEEELHFAIVWQYLLNALVDKISLSKDAVIHFPVVVEKRDELSRYDIDINIGKLANLAYRLEMEDYAIQLWERLENVALPMEYYLLKIAKTSYPQNLEYYEASQTPAWKERVLTEYRQHKDVILNDVQKNIVAKAVRSNKTAAQEYEELLPFLFLGANTIDACNKIIDEAVTSFSIPLNKDVLCAIVMARFNSISNWKKPKFEYTDPNAKMIFKAITLIGHVRKVGEIDNILGPAKPSKEVGSLVNSISFYSQNSCFPLVCAEVGKAVESRNSFAEALQYYRGVRTMFDAEKFRREVDLRYLLALERIAETKKDDEDKKKTLLEAEKLREKLELGDETISQKVEINSWIWEMLFKDAIHIGNEITHKNENPVPIKADETQKPLDVENRTSNADSPIHVLKAKQSIVFGTYYTITYIPNKKEVLIEYKKDDDDYRVKIKDGKYPVDSEIIMDNNGRLTIPENDVLTPFAVSLEKDKVTINVFEDEQPVGMKLVFSL